MRKSFVQINGKLCEKTGQYTANVDGNLWYCIAGHWMPADAPPPQSAMVMPDIAPYRSVIDGSEISSRSRHREHLRAHGCIEVGNERPAPRPVDLSLPGLRDELRARINR